MDDKKYEVILGCLLHDTGKLKYRYDDGRKHSVSGRDFLTEELGINQKEILNMVFFHHYDELNRAKIDSNSSAYISYIADNIAAFSDRREIESGDKGFDKTIKLQSVFNTLNDNNRNGSYTGVVLDSNYPVYPNKDTTEITESFYGKVIVNLKDNLKGMEKTKDYLQSYLEVLEANLSFVPSSTNRGEKADISLYDHVKLTAAYGSAIYEYLKSEGITDYKTELFRNSKIFYDKEAFLLVGIDISGIQSFIYNVIKENALKSLRARSFYLELILENVIDELFDELNYTRANLIYSGGGHAYLLLANTEKDKKAIENTKIRVNKWFMEEFGVELFLAMDYVIATANNFRDYPKNSYEGLFKNLSSKLSEQKIKRYTHEDINWLNNRMTPDGDRECKICKRTDSLDENGICSMCNSIINSSSGIIDKSHFMVHNNKLNMYGMKLPFNRWIYPTTESELRKYIEKDDGYIRAYSKNKYYSGKRISTNLWVGDYSHSRMLNELGKDAKGISRLAVIRADVDNLGKAFVSGFKIGENSDFVTLSRTATLSRMLSMFFKLNINYLLENPEFNLFEDEVLEKRRAIIIYSGGDDIFLVGQWADVIGFGIDLYNSLKKYSEGSLTISAGIGIFPEKYPISNMAEETGELEFAAKSHEYIINGKPNDKNSVCLFHENMVFTWDDLIEKVIYEKLYEVNLYIEALNKERFDVGSSLLYKMLSYIRDIEDDINLPRLLYILAKKTPKSEEGKEAQKRFLEKIYKWVRNENDRKQLEMAIVLHTYKNRGEENDI